MRRVWRWLGRMARVIALACGCGLLGWLAVRGTPPRPPVSVVAFAPSADAAPTPAEQARAHQRAREGRILFLTGLLYQGALVTAVLLTGGTRWLARFTARLGPRWVPALAVVFGVLTLGNALLTLPLEYYAGFLFPHRYGLSNQTTLQWLHDDLVDSAVGLVLGFPVVLLGYAVLRRSPRWWWLWLTAAMAPVLVFVMLIQPVFIAPLFNTFTPLPDTPLRHNLLAMAHAQHIPARDVYLVDASRQSNAINAYVAGFGPTLRIVLYDTLLQRFTPDEIQFIMAHEMGHYKLHHIYQGLLLALLGVLLGGYLLYRVSGVLLARYGPWLGVRALGDPAGYPLLLALGMLGGLLALPVGNAFSRHLEEQADLFAITIYPHPAVGIAAFHKLARYNIGEEDPPRWAEVLLSTHPSIAHRIAALRAPQ